MNPFKNQAFISLCLVATQASWVFGDTADAFKFYQEESQVTSGSRIASKPSQSAATTYVITREDIRDAGVQNIWDLLRTAPGVDVMQTRADQAEVSVRGLNQPLSNRTLVLLDGKTVLNAVFDYATWQSIPVTLDEIDRIEIVAGPASAIYGANAVSGVINIITQTPEQLQGGQVRYTGGERSAQAGSFVLGKQLDKAGYRIGAGWHTQNQYQDASRFASQAGEFDGLWKYRLSKVSDLSLSGGLTLLNTQTTTGAAGTAFDKGLVSFGRADYRYRDTRIRTFWNHARTEFNGFQFPPNPRLYSDTYDAEVQQSVILPFDQQIVGGVSFRRNTATSDSFGPDRVTQDLWAVFLEDRWDINDQWSLDGSARVDHHPFTPTMFSPRGSLIYTPVSEHVFRASAGTAFRNPTLSENYLNVDLDIPNDGTSLPNPPFTSILSHTVGNRDLGPERLESVEVAHNGDFGRLKTTTALFHYTLDQRIIAGEQQVVSAAPPTLETLRSYGNATDVLKAWGGETGFRIRLTPVLSGFMNYSYQYLRDDSVDQLIPKQSPRHKANAGIKTKKGGFTSTVWTHWVDHTAWSSNLNGDAPMPVSAYFLLNAHIGYALRGNWSGLEVGVTALNLLNHEHYEILGASDGLHPGQNGEIVKSHWLGTLSYQF